MREQLSMQLIHAQHAQNTVDSSAGKIESIVRALEATRGTGHGTCLADSPAEAPARRHCQGPVTDGPVTLGARPAVPGGIVMSPVPARWLTRKRPLRRQAAPARRVIRAAGCSGSTSAARWPGGRCRGSAFCLPIVAPTGLNVRLGARGRHRSGRCRRAGAPTSRQAGRLPYALLAARPQGLVSTSEKAPRSCTRLTVVATSPQDRARHRSRESIR